MKSAAKHIKRIDFTTGIADSDGRLIEGTTRTVSLLFNNLVISTDEVRDLIDNGEWEHDNRVVPTSTIQADLLGGHAKLI